MISQIVITCMCLVLMLSTYYVAFKAVHPMEKGLSLPPFNCRTELLKVQGDLSKHRTRFGVKPTLLLSSSRKLCYEQVISNPSNTSSHTVVWCSGGKT